MKHPSPLLRPLLTAAALVTALGASAEDANQPGEPAATREHRFPISVADLEARATAMFARIDGNADGVIDAAEFAAHDPGKGRHGEHRGFRAPGAPHMRGERQSPGAAGSARAANRAEHEAELFKQLDQDADGALSEAEFAGLQAARKVLMQQRAFTRLDANGDGVLDREEFPPRKLAGLDADGDGEISREEMRSQVRGARQSGKQQKAG
ncbi:MAG: EF-hand domain-containing protein [Pseudomonadales bacterium]